MQENFLCVIFSRQNVKKTEDAWRHQETIKYKKNQGPVFISAFQDVCVLFVYNFYTTIVTFQL